MYEYDSIKDFLKSFFKSRLLVLSLVILLMGGVLLHRLFTLQIVNGQSYQDNYTLRICKERVLNGTRGNILDCNGKTLAYNELTYKVTLEDNGTYSGTDERNEALNTIIAKVLTVLEENGDDFVNDFNIRIKKNGTYAFTVEDTQLMRFRADIYGKKKIEDLGFDDKLGYNTAEATEDQIIEYLCSEKRYGLADTDYSPEMKYKIMVIRYALAQNGYQKYISTTIAADISDKTMAYIRENKADLQGVDIEEDYIRKYDDSIYFASIIGYTGKISTEEYEELSKVNDSYELTDVIGKSGIEQIMDEKLQGAKGSETVFVDVMGKELEVTDHKEPSAGNNIYLSIDADLQKAVYHLLEQELAGILFNKIINVKEYVNTTGQASDIKIPIYDVYYALIQNNIIDTSHFTHKKASATERTVQAIYESHLEAVISRIREQCTGGTPEVYQLAPEEYQNYYSYIVSMLLEKKVLLDDQIDKTDATYLAWTKEESISLKEYLAYCINMGWIDYNIFQTGEEYSDSSEIYMDLIHYIEKELKKDEGFQKKIYQYLIRQDMVSGTQLCLILYDQKLIKKDEEKRAQLENGTISAFTFLKEKVQYLEITPGQLALDPCTASCVITDVKTGELKALVSYPGYDNNMLANTVDAEYFAKLQTDEARPLYNHATQERTAPGSTFKMVTATAGLSEGIITPSTKINNQGKFKLVDNEPECWIYPASRHGWMDVTNAIRVSCNYFFYQVGYDLSLVGNTYSDPTGIRKITDYAKAYGLGDTTGIEIPENKPEIASQFPVMASIGQSNHNYATVQLARYVTAVANKGTVYNYTLLKQMTDHNGKVIESYEPTVKNKMDMDDSHWKAIQNGNRLVVANLAEFKDFPMVVAGKTGTAQQVLTRGNHALFVGYAPFKDPEISIATRIAYGYTSHNAADVSAQILKYYFRLEDTDKLLNGQAKNVGDSANGITD